MRTHYEDSQHYFCQINYYAYKKVKLHISTLSNLTFSATGVPPTIFLFQYAYSLNLALRFIFLFSDPTLSPYYAHCYLTLHLPNNTPRSMLFLYLQHFTYITIHLSLYIICLLVCLFCFLKIKKNI